MKQDDKKGRLGFFKIQERREAGPPTQNKKGLLPLGAKLRCLRATLLPAPGGRE